MRRLILAAISCTAGCAIQPPQAVPEPTPAESNDPPGISTVIREHYDCRVTAEQGVMPSNPTLARETFRECMSRKGWWVAE